METNPDDRDARRSQGGPSRLASPLTELPSHGVILSRLESRAPLIYRRCTPASKARPDGRNVA